MCQKVQVNNIDEILEQNLIYISIGIMKHKYTKQTAITNRFNLSIPK